MPVTPRLAAVACALAFFLPGVAPAGTIWREGEDATQQTMNRHPWWYDQVKKDQLSGGDWISNFAAGADKVGTAAYPIAVEEPGDYHFWLRANPVATSLSYRLDNGEWTAIDFGGAIDTANIAADDKIDLRFIAWVQVGQLKLTRGAHTLAFRMDSENSNHGAIDAFVLTTEHFVPQGKLKPGESAAPAAGSEAANDGETWAWSYRENRFDDGAIIDLRSMNEAVAGEHGFIRLSEDGESFVRGDGEPIRFWAVLGRDEGSAQHVERHVRFLAKMGVNMARLHKQVPNMKDGAKITDVNDREIDRIHRFVAAAKKQGIYTTISPFWAHSETPASWGIDGYDKVSPWGLMYFNDDLKNAYKAWVRELYTRPNPYADGLPLAQDPAVAIIQIKNEDSLFFWTTQAIRPEQQRVLGRKFGQWLTKKYGSLAKARQAWQNTPHDNDDFANGVVGIMLIWEMTQEQTGGKAVRVNDQTAFFTQIQRDFYEEIEQFYRSELGCKQLINATNWITADNVKLNDLERYTYTANDVIAVNKYYSGVHTGENNGWRIDPGHHFTSPSALLYPHVRSLPTNLKQVAGYPMIITESSWVHPTEFQSEGPFLMAAYQSLTGVDAFYWFAPSAPEYDRSPYFTFLNMDGQHPHHKWTCSTPDLIGQFPAFAIAFRNGYIRQGEPVVHEERTLEEMIERKAPIIAEDATFDPNRWEGKTGAAASVIDGGVNPLAFLVGPVEVVYGGDPRKSRAIDLSEHIDGDAKIIRSVTGEITMDHGRGVCTIDAPKIQGVAGFLERVGAFKLGDVAIESGNDYATIAVVAMDDRPIASSKRLLVQVGTKALPTGWQVEKATFTSGEGGERHDGYRIVNTGKMPWRITNTKATLTVRNAGLTRATLLDTNGYPWREAAVERIGDALRIALPPETMYLVLE